MEEARGRKRSTQRPECTFPPHLRHCFHPLGSPLPLAMERGGAHPSLPEPYWSTVWAVWLDLCSGQRRRCPYYYASPASFFVLAVLLPTSSAVFELPILLHKLRIACVLAAAVTSCQ